jgi:3-oxoacyl-[acyl-carrier protein] reductase
MRLLNRFAIITGASQGLGEVIAESYVRAGASVLLCARTESTLQATRDRLSALLQEGQVLLAAPADVSDPAHVDRLIATAREAFPRVDILVNNAGVYGPMGAIEDIPWEDWERAISVNLMGTVYMCRAVVPLLKEDGYGKIVNLSGGGATSPLPFISAYAASKAAVVRFTETLAHELRQYGIDVNAVAPGALATRMMDQAIAAGPESVGEEFHARMLELKEEGGTPLALGAALVTYLGSSESDGITGRLLSAVWDPWSSLQEHREELEGSDIYTLRRVVPEDRGKNWDPEG